MNPISNTAFYCCGIRMLDAQSKRPICNDTHAATFMDTRGMEIFKRFNGELAPNVSNVCRHRYIDDFLREKIAANPQLQVILIGCGFDSRAFRLAGAEWLELDEPQLIEYKNEKLPPSNSGNKLQRIPISFASDSLADKLAPFASDRQTIFVIEGVTMYLPDGVLDSTLVVLRKLFPNHEVIADLMTKRFIDTFGKSIRNIIAQMGANMIPPDHPEAPFVRCGYREVRYQSIVKLVFKYRGIGPVAVLLAVFAPKAVSGYTIRVYKPQ